MNESGSAEVMLGDSSFHGTGETGNVHLPTVVRENDGTVILF